METTPEFRTIVPRDPSGPKCRAILTLAKRGLLPLDVITLRPQDVSVNKDKLIINSIGKTLEFDFESAKPIAEYMSAYAKNITAKGTLFYTDKSETLTVHSITRSLNNWLKKNKVTDVIPGWSVVKPGTSPKAPIKSMDDIAAVLRSIQGK